MVDLTFHNLRSSSPTQATERTRTNLFQNASARRLAIAALLLTPVWATTASTSFGQGLTPAPETPPTASAGLQQISNDVLIGACAAFSERPSGQDHAVEFKKDAYVFVLSSSNALSVSIDDKVQYSLDQFNFSNRYECVGKLAELLSHAPLSPLRSCRIPQNGVEKYQTQTRVSQQSPEMGGGHSQSEWCSTLVSILRGQYPGGEFVPESSGESTRNHCSPFNCPQYVYTCTVRVNADPIYKLASSSNCP